MVVFEMPVTEEVIQAIERTRDREWIADIRQLDIRNRILVAGLTREVEQEASQLVSDAVGWSFQTTGAEH